MKRSLYGQQGVGMLFGHQNDDTIQPLLTTPVAPDEGVNPLAVDPTTGASLPVAQPQSLEQASEPSILNQQITSASDDMTAATAPTIDPPTPFATAPAPVDTPTLPNADPAPMDMPAANDDTTATPTDDDLLALKQQALAQLSPLVGQLDQTPEERFRTTMMMIQSTDNQALIQDAYDASQQITDEKIRAQALLDVINEINYFTQQKPAS